MPPRLVIVNPASASGRTEKRWPKVVDDLRRRGLELEVEVTHGPCEATRLAREFVSRGGREIVALGGDGTLNEVVAGCVSDAGDAMAAQGIVLSIVHQGTGGDIARGLGIPKDAEHAIEVAASGDVRPVDVGVATYATPDGATATRGWLSCCNVGIGADVVERVTGRYKRLGDSAGFALGSVATFLRNTPRPVRISFDGASEPLELDVTEVTAANNRYMGGGMMVAPDAVIDDGLLDVVVISAANRLRLVRTFPRIYKGTHASDELVRIIRSSELTVESTGDDQQGVVLDGELVGTTPARMWLLPRGLSVRVPPPPAF